MGKLIYAAKTSLDGFLEDESGSFDWSVSDDELHAFWNEHERHIGTSLHGRRMYETMLVWEGDEWLTTRPAVVREDAEICRDADKVVYSSTLEKYTTSRPRIEQQFEPDAIRELLDLELLEHRRFGNGVIHVRHAVRSATSANTTFDVEACASGL